MRMRFIQQWKVVLDSLNDKFILLVNFMSVFQRRAVDLNLQQLSCYYDKLNDKPS